MPTPHRAQRSEVERLVLDRFQRYVGASDDLSLSVCLEDLHIESLAFIAIVLDVAGQLDVEFASDDHDLSSIETLDDVVSLICSLPEPVG
jgi:acyl carrier protein